MNKWKKIRRANLGTIPQQASENLNAPELAPSRKENSPNKRIKPLNFKVSEEFFWNLKQSALHEKRPMVEVVEKAMEDYWKRKNIQ